MVTYCIDSFRKGQQESFTMSLVYRRVLVAYTHSIASRCCSIQYWGDLLSGQGDSPYRFLLTPSCAPIFDPLFSLAIPLQTPPLRIVISALFLVFDRLASIGDGASSRPRFAHSLPDVPIGSSADTFGLILARSPSSGIEATTTPMSEARRYGCPTSTPIAECFWQTLTQAW